MTDTDTRIVNLLGSDLEFNANNHRYKIAGTKTYVPSVTTILNLLNKPFLVAWAANIGAEAVASLLQEVCSDDDRKEQTLEEAADWLGEAAHTAAKQAHAEKRDEGASVGTEVHNAVHQWHLDPVQVDPPESEAGQLAFGAFLEWWAGQNLKALEVERVVADPHGNYCGTLDLIAQSNDGAIHLVDIKTSNKSESNPLGMYPENVFQLAAYAMAFEAETGRIVDHAWIVAAGKDGRLASFCMDGADIERYAHGFNLLAEFLPILRGAEKHVRAAQKDEKARLAELADNEETT
jgi:hypothetical protein